jgi:cob(I)alamin adenosyltransferase
MVRLSLIYTKTGDDGTTGLGDGSRADKTDPRVEAYGTVDEANAALGLCIVEARRDPSHRSVELARLLTTIQNDLFDVGADLCCPIAVGGGVGEKPGQRLRITPAQTERLERAIDDHNVRLKPLDSFVLPGGTPLAAALHLARTISRRAERCTVHLTRVQPDTTNLETVKFLNRLSDLLFVLGRVANDDGQSDVKWIPGASRAS